MKKLISVRLAGNLLLAAMTMLIIFHILVMTGILPSQIVWGGQINEAETNMVLLETIALIVSLLFTGIIAAKTGYLLRDRYRKIIDISMWIIFAYFLFNIVGNLASAAAVESLIFAPLTIILAFLAFRLALG